jgi:hypothetical protein
VACSAADPAAQRSYVGTSGFPENSIAVAHCAFKYVHAAFGDSVCPGGKVEQLSNSTWMVYPRWWQTGKSGGASRVDREPGSYSRYSGNAPGCREDPDLVGLGSVGLK